MTELAEFLLARITEDAEVAVAAAADEGGRWLATGPTSIEASFGELTDSMGAWSGLTEVRRPSITGHITRWDPARVLAECEAKRRLIDEMGEADGLVHQLHDVGDYGVVMKEDLISWRFLRYLALPYADHPDYREEWKI